MHSRIIRSGLAAAAIVALVACGGQTGEPPSEDPATTGAQTGDDGAGDDGADDGSGGGEPTSLVVAMGHEQPYPGEEAVMYAIPKGLGLFDEAGVDVTFEFAAGSGVAIQLVEAGNADMGQGNPSAVLAAIEKDADVHLVYNIIPRYGSGLAVLPDGPIQSTGDLDGATIGVASLQSSRLLDAQAMVRAAGLDPDTDVSFVAAGVGAQAATALTSGQVDGLYLWDAAYESMQLSGTDLNVIRDVFPGAESLLDFVQYANGDALADKRDAIGAWGRASVIAQQWAADHPEEALELYYAEFPNAQPTDDEGRDRDFQILQFTLDQFSPDDGNWGAFDEAAVDRTAAFLQEGGLLDQALPASDYLADDLDGLIDAYNDVSDDDVEAITN